MVADLSMDLDDQYRGNSKLYRVWRVSEEGETTLLDDQGMHHTQAELGIHDRQWKRHAEKGKVSDLVVVWPPYILPIPPSLIAAHPLVKASIVEKLARITWRGPADDYLLAMAWSRAERLGYGLDDLIGYASNSTWPFTPYEKLKDAVSSLTVAHVAILEHVVSSGCEHEGGWTIGAFNDDAAAKLVQLGLLATSVGRTVYTTIVEVGECSWLKGHSAENETALRITLSGAYALRMKRCSEEVRRQSEQCLRAAELADLEDGVFDDFEDDFEADPDYASDTAEDGRTFVEALS